MDDDVRCLPDRVGHLPNTAIDDPPPVEAAHELGGSLVRIRTPIEVIKMYVLQTQLPCGSSSEGRLAAADLSGHDEAGDRRRKV